MGPNRKPKKGNKAHNPGRARGVNKRPLVSPIVVARPAPVTPIPPLVVRESQPELKMARTANGRERTIKKWCIERTPVYYTPTEPWPSSSLNKAAVVEVTGQEQTTSVNGVKTSWSEVAYRIPDGQTGMKWVTGWVNDAYLDDYNEKFLDSGVSIPTPTPDPTDAQQYLLLEGKVRYNMCGELCVAFIVNDDIDSVLVKWKKNSPGSYNAILGAGRDNPTSERDLRNLLEAILAEYDDRSDGDRFISMRDKLTYPVDAVSLFGDLNRMLPTHYLISGVKMSGATGELVRKDDPLGKGHWVVVDKLSRHENRVEIYNPFPNTREEYSFTEFFASFSTNSGIWVKRKRVRPSSPAEDLPKFEVAIGNPNPRYSAVQFIDIDGKKKTNLCGEFCVAFILKESIDAVLERWKEVQPVFYDHYVGGNKGTGTYTLATILKAYGYNSEGDFTEFTKGLVDPFLKIPLISPGRIAKMLKTHFLIAGVNIDGGTGKLKPGDDVRHWVVLDKLSPVRKNRGWVELYNPYQNCWEEYSYKEFIKAVGSWSGLWVKRNIVPIYVPQVVESISEKDQPPKGHWIARWTEGQLDAVIRQRRKSEKPIPKIAAELSQLSGWKPREIIKKLKTVMKTGKADGWNASQLQAEMSRRLRNGQPVKKIAAQLTKVSGWKKHDIDRMLRDLITAQRWEEPQLVQAIKERLQARKPENKIAAELVERSGWKRREILIQLQKLKQARRWTEGQLRAEISRRLSLREPLNRIAADLAVKAGWKRQEVRQLASQAKEAARWTELRLVQTITEKLKNREPANRIAAELVSKSGWKKREILGRLQDLREAVRWTETQVREEIEKQLEIGTPVNKILSGVSDISGWRRWEVRKILQTARKVQRDSQKVHLTISEEPIKAVHPRTIIHASKPRDQFVEWQNRLLSRPNSNLRRVRRWGDDVMIKYGMDVNQVNTTNFQAVGLYNNGNKEFGAITNYLRIPHKDVMRLKAMQIEDDYEAKSKTKDWRKQKMNWLCKDRGSLYFFYHHTESGDWQKLSYIEWGTLALGGNLVQVEGTELVHAKLRDGTVGDVQVARLKGFTPRDWDRPLDDLLAEGLVHRCFCAYKSNRFGDSPRGIVYSPFYSPQHWEFVGKMQPTALFIPVEWLEPKKL